MKKLACLIMIGVIGVSLNVFANGIEDFEDRANFTMVYSHKAFDDFMEEDVRRKEKERELIERLKNNEEDPEDEELVIDSHLLEHHYDESLSLSQE